MAELESRYRADINFRWVNDAHILALGRVPAGSRVLDLGTGDGSMARTLTQMGCEVWAVEMDPESAEKARKWCREVVVADLNGLDLAKQFRTQKFDVVLMLDVLEHVVDPGSVLSRVATVLDQRGWGIVSIPNVAHASVRLDLLEGRFTYRDTGLLDRTHLRFFDRPGLETLIHEAGYETFDQVAVIKELGTTEIPMDHPDPDLVARLADDPDAWVFQFVWSLAPTGSSVLTDPPLLPLAETQAMALELLASVRALEEGVAFLRQQLGQATTVDLPHELEVIRLASEDRRRQLRDLLVAIEEDSERWKFSGGRSR
ncbi:MAG TPA: class I SAM-dependent methyltransferase [Acidimicrobiales bacterium]|jgi:2-polyprenyl-3-methyl-5-hydroxy-6-metoxy-1,4-benzoquinol methylase